MKKRLMAFVTLIIFAGCAEIKPPQNHYYLLDTAQTQHVGQLSAPVSVRIELAQYLAQGSLVLQLDEQRIQPSHYHRWAEPLSGMIERYLQRQLQQLEYLQNDQTLTIVIDRFHGSPTGDVRFSGQWWKSGAHPPKPQPFDFHAHQNGAGYDQLVSELQQLLNRLAREVAP